VFLEATQLKTAPTGRFVGLSGEKAVVEVQVVALVPAPVDDQLHP
jgi:hypothetical protein